MLAKDYMDQQLELNNTLINNLMREGQITIDEYKTEFEKLTYPISELLEKANEMYGFVNKKDDDK